jgi:quercetin dioxygenase-like cupin family protein
MFEVSMPFYNPNDRPVKHLVPGMHIRTFWGEQQLLSLVELDANTILPRHSHPHEQSTLVLEGELEFELGGETRTIRAGELVIIPGGVEHFVTVGPMPTRVLDTFSPVREDLKY